MAPALSWSHLRTQSGYLLPLARSPCSRNSRIWPQRPALVNWERADPGVEPSGLAIPRRWRRRKETGWDAGPAGRERQGQVAQGVTPPLPRGPQQVDSAQRAARGPQADPKAGCCWGSQGAEPQAKASPETPVHTAFAGVWSRIRLDGRL